MALAALLAPAHPSAALSLLSGQTLAALNFFFLEKLVKLFTEAALAQERGRGAVAQARLLLIAGAKVLFVYGGAFALTRWRAIELAPLLAGLSAPLAALFLKAIALGLAPAAASLRAARGRTAARGLKPLAVLLFAGALLAHPTPNARASATPPPAAASTAAARATEPPMAAAETEHAAASSEEGGEEEGGEQHLPNWITIANDWLPGNPVVHWMHENEYLVFAWIAGLAFFGIALLAMRRGKMVPGRLQNGIEWIVESMEGVVGGMLGKHTERYFPFIMAIFFYILMMNMIGIIPGFKSSTSTLDVTLALALITFLYVQYSGIRNLGFLGYLDHLAGSPRDVVGFAMLPVMIPVHVLGELVKPVSLSCRLFGNIFGEDTLIVVFVGVAALCLKASLTALAVPPMLGITALFMLLQTLTSIVQALIFSLLTTVYLYMMLPHEPHDHGAHAPGEDEQHPLAHNA